MTERSGDCPDEDLLVQLVEGALDGATLGELEAHLDRCESCAAVIAGLGALAAPGDRERRVGRYQLERRIAAGGMGEVWAAWDPELRREIAVKLVRPDRADDGRERERLLREARALARLGHPNVLAVYDVGEIDGEVFIATELVAGDTLASRGGPRADWRAVVQLYGQAARGLAAAHAAGLVHRDVKPANLLLGADGRVRIADFGLARRARPPTPSAMSDTVDLRRSAEASMSITATGHVAGTPAYMAPEQRAGMPADARADQYALCVALVEAIAGVRPGAATDRDALRALLAEHRPRDPAPDALCVVLARGLSADPPRRFPTTAALADALEAVLAADARGLRGPAHDDLFGATLGGDTHGASRGGAPDGSRDAAARGVQELSRGAPAGSAHGPVGEARGGLHDEAAHRGAHETLRGPHEGSGSAQGATSSPAHPDSRSTPGGSSRTAHPDSARGTPGGSSRAAHPDSARGSAHPDSARGSAHPGSAHPGSAHPDSARGSAHPDSARGSAHADSARGSAHADSAGDTPGGPSRTAHADSARGTPGGPSRTALADSARGTPGGPSRTVHADSATPGGAARGGSVHAANTKPRQPRARGRWKPVAMGAFGAVAGVAAVLVVAKLLDRGATPATRHAALVEPIGSGTDRGSSTNRGGDGAITGDGSTSAPARDRADATDHGDTADHGSARAPSRDRGNAEAARASNRPAGVPLDATAPPPSATVATAAAAAQPTLDYQVFHIEVAQRIAQRDVAGCRALTARALRDAPPGGRFAVELYEGICDMIGGDCAGGVRKLERTYASQRLELTASAFTDQYCPIEGDLETRVARLGFQAMAHGSARIDLAWCTALVPAANKLAAEVQTPPLRARTAVALKTLAKCIASTGRCDDGRALWKRGAELDSSMKLAAPDLGAKCPGEAPLVATVPPSLYHGVQQAIRDRDARRCIQLIGSVPTNIDPRDQALLEMYRAHCEMIAGDCAAGRARLTQVDPSGSHGLVPSGSLRATWLSSNTDMYCPIEGSLDARLARIWAQLDTFTTRSADGHSVAWCQHLLGPAKTAAGEASTPAQIDRAARNLRRLATCISSAGQCDDGRALWTTAADLDGRTAPPVLSAKCP